MFRDSFQRGFFSIFFSAGSNPLNLWDTHVQNGHISRLLDPELKNMVMDICGYNVSTTYITCPKGKRTLGIYLPFMVMIVKNLKKYFSFEVTIRDSEGFKRRFRVSNFQSTTQINPMCTAMPIGLSDGWNQIQFNLSDFTRRAYNKHFTEVVSIKINANIRLRRIYFTDRLVPEEELPNDYRLFVPMPMKVKKKKSDDKYKESTGPIAPKDIEPETESKTKIRKPSQESFGRVESRHSSLKLDEYPGEGVKLERVKSQGSRTSEKSIPIAITISKTSKERIEGEALTGLTEEVEKVEGEALTDITEEVEKVEGEDLKDFDKEVTKRGSEEFTDEETKEFYVPTEIAAKASTQLIDIEGEQNLPLNEIKAQVTPLDENIIKDEVKTEPENQEYEDKMETDLEKGEDQTDMDTEKDENKTENDLEQNDEERQVQPEDLETVFVDETDNDKELDIA